MYGRELGINGDAAVMIDALRPTPAADLSVYGGTPMALYKASASVDAAIVSYNYLKANSLSTNVMPWGLSNFNKNAYKNEAFDPLAYNGSGKGSVFVDGRVTLFPGNFRQVDGTFLQVASFITTDTYTPGAPLFVNLELTSAGLAGANFGKITSTKHTGTNDHTFCGTVVDTWTTNNVVALEMLIARGVNVIS